MTYGIQRSMSGATPRRAGFTVIELLAVLGLVGVLGSLIVIGISRATERARVAKVHAELRQIEMALESYRADHKRYPPVRVSCNTDEKDNWCQLPDELVQGAYLPPSVKAGISSFMEDPFNPGRTYKYAKTGAYYLNSDLQPDGFPLFIPDGFPTNIQETGTYHTDEGGPLAWVVWSLGPRQSKDKALHPRAPMSPATWYAKPGDHGVLARIAPRDRCAFFTP